MKIDTSKFKKLMERIKKSEKKSKIKFKLKVERIEDGTNR